MRLFFALWPPPELARDLAEFAVQIAGQTGGRAMLASNIHLTLSFLGEVANARSSDAADAGRAAQKHARGGLLRLGAVRYWKKGGVVWAGPTQPVPGVLGLAQALREELEARGFSPEDKPFAPHVTLLRRAGPPGPPAPPPSIEWPVREFLLVRSEQTREGSIYTPLERFALDDR